MDLHRTLTFDQVPEGTRCGGQRTWSRAASSNDEPLVALIGRRQEQRIWTVRKYLLEVSAAVRGVLRTVEAEVAAGEGAQTRPGPKARHRYFRGGSHIGSPLLEWGGRQSSLPRSAPPLSRRRPSGNGFPPFVLLRGRAAEPWADGASMLASKRRVPADHRLSAIASLRRLRPVGLLPSSH